MYRCSNSSPRYSVRTTMLPLYTIQKFLRFPFYKISITLLLFSYVLDRVTSIRIQKYKKSVICHSTITDFILTYSLIPLFCLGFGIPIASLNSSLLRLNQLTCDTPSIVKSNFPLSSSLMEQIERLASKLWLNSEE